MRTSDPDVHDDTTDEHERFQEELLAQERDARCPSTADLDEETAWQVVRYLLDPGTVTPIVDRRVLVHEPSGAAFESMQQLAVFHGALTAGHEAAETEP